MLSETSIDIFNPTFKANPYPVYAQMRETQPVYRVATSPIGVAFWLITRYDDVFMTLKDARFVKNPNSLLTPEELAAQPPIPEMLAPLAQNMLDLDDPDHARLRGLVHKAFTPALVEQMRERIQAITNSLLDEAEAKGEMDLISAFAFPLPMTVIAEILGVPVADRDKFRQWSRIIVDGSFAQDPEGKYPQMIAFMTYLKEMVDERRREPKNDLISSLVQTEEAGDKLNESELLSMIFLLLIAGHETTVNLIGNGTLALLRHPDQLEMLKNNPSLIKSAVEELLRYDSPLETATERYASEDIEVAGTVIPRGDMVFAVIGSANRDASHFENPDNLDITRTDNKHLTFGQGVHYCLGAPLARLEGQIAINTLLQRMPNLRLAVEPETLQWRGGMVLRGVETLPVRF